MNRMPRPPRLAAAALAAALSCAGPALAEGGDFVPKLDAARLEIGGRARAPARLVVPALPGRTFAAGDLRVQVEGSRIVAVREDTGKEAVVVPTGEESGAFLLGAGADGIVYVHLFATEMRDGQRVVEAPARVRRLSLETGKWLEPLLIPDARPGEDAIHVLPAAEGLTIVLSAVEKTDPDLHERQLALYRVTAFRTGPAGIAEKLWSRAIESAGDVPSPGVGLLGGGGPRYAAAGLEMLSLAGDDVIVCAGPSQDILALARKTGEVRWRLARIWEFERGFIGPSVWQHFIARFGRDDFLFGAEEEQEKKVDPEKRKALAASCRIVAGPVAVPFEKEHRLLVAVAKARGLTGYVDDCVVYEVSARGEPVAILDLPRMVIGGRDLTLPDGVVWLCERGAVAKVAPTRQSGFTGMGPGGTDCVGRLAWYREPAPPPPPDAWLATGPAGHPSAFGEAVLVAVAGGGYVRSKDEKVFRFPLRRLDLATGAETALVLSIPFEGDAPPPTDNYRSTGAGSEARYETLGPYLMGVTRLDARGSRLEVTIGTSSTSATLFFELPP